MDQKTVNQLEQLIQQLLTKAMANIVTKDDAKDFAKKSDLKDFVTKEYLDHAFKNQREIISEDFGEVVNELVLKLDEKKADRTDLAKLERHVDRLEQKIVA